MRSKVRVFPSRPRPARRSTGRIHISDFRQHHLTCERQPVHTFGALATATGSGRLGGSAPIPAVRMMTIGRLKSTRFRSFVTENLMTRTRPTCSRCACGITLTQKTKRGAPTSPAHPCISGASRERVLPKLGSHVIERRSLHMRFIPNIRYGTERYPEKVARRLRLANIAAWVGTLLTAGSAIRQYTGDYPGSWKLAAINATAALV